MQFPRTVPLQQRKESGGEGGKIVPCFYRKTRVEKGGEIANENKKSP